jgi:transcriptional regulator with XRE-family HTH domain
MPFGLDSLNQLGKHKSLGTRNDLTSAFAYAKRMKPHQDWYLREWLQSSGKKQADVVNDLDWNKARVSLMLSGKQQYTRDAINEISDWLHIRPHELLMHPDEAYRLRRIQSTALEIAAQAAPDDETDSDNTVAKLAS